MSGYGFHGGPSRCSSYWQEFAKCYSSVIHPSQCKEQRDDYLECVHRTKEKAHKAAFAAQLRKASAEELEEYKKAASETLAARVGSIPTSTDEGKK